MGEDLDPQPLLVDAVLGHVVAVMVGEQQVRHGQFEPLDRLEQRTRRPARVDEHAVAALLVGHEVGVGEPIRVHGAFDDHGRARYAAMDASDFRAEFPVLERVVYLNTGTDGPVPRRGYEAAEAQLRRELTEGRLGRPHFDLLMERAGSLRFGLAQALGCAETEVALTPSTTDGVAT